MPRCERLKACCVFSKYRNPYDFKNSSRLLLTSSKAVRRLLRRNEMHGWNQRALDQEAHDQRVVANIRKKWGIAPALTVEFVAYYHDRWQR